MTTLSLAKVFMTDMPNPVKWALYITIIMWAAWGFKQFEPKIMPVISAFDIDSVEHTDGKTLIAGTMIKERDCRFREIVAYSDNHLVKVIFTETVNIVSRVEGKQAWGVWAVVPDVDNLVMYARHDCVSGRVLTKLWEGEL